jgi:hypothetical protein
MSSIKRSALAMNAVFLFLLCSLFSQAQQTVATNTNVVVPPLVSFSGVLTGTNGKPLTRVVGVTFLLYQDQQGGAPLWMETQNVQLDSRGHYSVMLGATSSTGLPADIFVAGEAHWLGVQAQGQDEQPRVLLVSAPYALKAGDAQTLGGLPASAFVLAGAPGGAATSITASAPESAVAASVSMSSDATSDVTTTGGTVNALPLFSTATNIQNSLLTQTAKTAINVGGKLNLLAIGTATASAGKDSQPQDFVASAFNSGTSTAVAQTFQLQAEPAGNDTATTSGTFNLLYGSGTATPAETGFKISNKGLITFAAGQTFPGTGTGDGTITGITAGTDLTGGGTSGKVTLSLNTSALNAAYPQLAANNTFIGTETINNTVTISGTNSSGALQVTNTTSTGEVPAILATGDSSTGYGVYGSSPNVGVFGNGTGSGGIGLDGHGTIIGAKGIATETTSGGTGVYGGGTSSTSYGVEGQSANVGVFGQSDGASATGVIDGTISGVWGDTGGSSNEFYSGVMGTADENYAGYFNNNSSTTPGVFIENDAESSSSATVLETYGGNFGGTCYIDVSGDINCSGTLSGVVSADSGTRKVAVYSMQSAENWLEDAGSGQLANGSAHIVLDSIFAQTVNTGVEYHVFLTPKGDCEGLYVTNETPAGFEVHELRGGHSGIAFDYRIMAKRAGYENVRLADLTARSQLMEQQHQQIRLRKQARLRARAAASPIASSTIASHK